MRASCFWLAVALLVAAVAKDLVAPLLSVLMFLPLGFGIRELMKALGARDAGKLAERVAEKLTTALGPEYVVLTEYAPRAGTGVVPLIVVGPSGISAIEPLGEDAAFGCYNDGWHRVEAQGLHHLAYSPSRNARDHAARVRSDISGGGHLRVTVDAYVLLERGSAEGCASSTVPVICGVAALADRLRSRAPRAEASARLVQAVADALTHPLAVAV